MNLKNQELSMRYLLKIYLKAVKDSFTFSDIYSLYSMDLNNIEALFNEWGEGRNNF